VLKQDGIDVRMGIRRRLFDLEITTLKMPRDADKIAVAAREIAEDAGDDCERGPLDSYIDGNSTTLLSQSC
jgi:hypothetical protein